MEKHVYTITKTATIGETFHVIAKSEQEAIDKLVVSPTYLEWINAPLKVPYISMRTEIKKGGKA